MYSGIELKVSLSALPDGVAPEDWIVNNFYISGNSLTGNEHDYVIDPYLSDASWTSVLLDTQPLTDGSDLVTELLIDSVEAYDPNDAFPDVDATIQDELEFLL